MLSVTSESVIACFQLACTGLSAELMNRVPISTPSAPRANAPAMPWPSTIPPAAIDRHVDPGADLLQQGEQVRRAHAAQAAALGALDDQPVDAGVDRPLGVGEAAHLVVVLHAGVLGPPGDRRRVADAGDEQRGAPVEDPVEDLVDAALALEHAQEHLQPERRVGVGADQVVLGGGLVEAGRARLHQPHAAGRRDRAGELRPGRSSRRVR